MLWGGRFEDSSLQQMPGGVRQVEYSIGVCEKELWMGLSASGIAPTNFDKNPLLFQ